jgi:hypothetical protein
VAIEARFNVKFGEERLIVSRPQVSERSAAKAVRKLAIKGATKGIKELACQNIFFLM